MSDLDKAFDDMLDNIAEETKNDQAQQNLLKLADDLEAKDPEKYRIIITRCRNYYYHDFNSPAAMPKMEMHQDLLAAGLNEVDLRMQDGEFDS